MDNLKYYIRVIFTNPIIKIEILLIALLVAFISGHYIGFTGGLDSATTIFVDGNIEGYEDGLYDGMEICVESLTPMQPKINKSPYKDTL